MVWRYPPPIITTSCCLWFVVILLAGVTSGFQIVKDIPGRSRSTTFYADVRAADGSGEWQTAFVLQTTSKNTSDETIGLARCGYFSHLNGWSASWVNIELDPHETGVQVRVGWFVDESFESARTHPRSAGATVLSVEADEVVLKTSTVPSQFMVDFNVGMDGTDTGAAYKGPPVHTFAVFVNPPLPVPNPENDPTVVPVSPGEPIPTVPAGSTLLFLDGVHTVPPDENGYHYWSVPSNVTVFLSSGAILHAALRNDGDYGKDFITVVGYGTLSGEEENRFGNTTGDSCPSGNPSPQGITTHGAKCTNISGITLVDFPNHHLILGAASCYSACEQNVYENSKVWGWRTNGDGVHAFGSWQVRNLFLRTQDDSMYTHTSDEVKKGCMPSTYERLTTWNDANGASFMVTGQDTLLHDSDVIYSRTSYNWWTGGRVFANRYQGPTSGVQVKNIRIEDPLPSYNPWTINVNDKGAFQNVTFEDISITNFSVVHTCTHSGCSCSPPCTPSGNGDLPWGIPNVFAATAGTEFNISNVAFVGVTVNNQPLLQVLSADPGYFNLSGYVTNFTVDGKDIAPYWGS